MSFSVPKLVILALCRTLIACELNLLSDSTSMTSIYIEFSTARFSEYIEIQTPAIRIFTRKFCFAMHLVLAIILNEAYDQFYSWKSSSMVIWTPWNIQCPPSSFSTPLASANTTIVTNPYTFTSSFDSLDRFFIEIHRSS